MNIVFFGTPKYAIPILSSLHKAYNRGRERQLIAVVTQPPKPVGREKKVEHSPVDNWAFKHNLPIATNINDAPIADLGVLASYGKIIPQNIIDRFKFGIINIHPSALPEFRGPSPIQANIFTGKKDVIVTAIKMDDKMDHGPILSTFKEQIELNDTSETLRSKVFDRSAEFVVELIPAFMSGKITLKPQDESKATYTKLIKKVDGHINPEYISHALTGETSKKDWEISWLPDYSTKPTADALNNFIRAMNPWPVAWSDIFINETALTPKKIKFIKSHIEEGHLVLDIVQLEGKNAVSWNEFKRGYPKFRFG